MKRKSSSRGPKRQAKRARYQGTVHQRALTVPRLPRVDYKATDFLNGPTSITTTATILNLTTNLVPGTGFSNNFVGREVVPVALDVRYEVVGAVSNAFAAADYNNKTRVLIFQWEDSASPVATGILQNANVLAPISLINYENIDVLSDQIYSTYCSSYDSASGYANSTSHTERIYIKRKKLMPLLWNSSASDFQKGTIYCLVISDSTVAPSPSFSIQSRLIFQDA